MWRAAVVLVVVVMVAPALAAQGPTITASNYAFTPAELTVTPGESVRLANAGGFHSFEFADGSYPANPTSSDDPVWDELSRTFAAAGDYTFVCGAHPEMTGVVHVRDDPPATPTASPTSTPTPAPSAPPEVRSLKMAASTFCVRRCAKPGVRVRIDLSAPASVTGTLRRRGRRFGAVRFGTVAAGARTLKFRRTTSGRRLVAGRYALRLLVAGERQPVLRFSVR